MIRQRWWAWMMVVLALALLPAQGCGARPADDDDGDDGGSADDGADERDQQRDPFWNVLTEGEMDSSKASAEVTDGVLRMTAHDMAEGERFTVYQAQMEAGFDLSVDFVDVAVAGPNQTAFFFVRSLASFSWVMAGVTQASNTGDTIITVQAIDENAPLASDAVAAITETAGTMRIVDQGDGFLASVTVGEVSVSEVLSPTMEPPFLVGFTLGNFSGEASTGEARLALSRFYGSASGIEFDEFYWDHLK